MLINVLVDEKMVGTRIGCDVQVGDESCKKVSVGTPLFHEGLPRDICEACMTKIAPGKPVLSFMTNHYDSFTEKYVTNASVRPEVDAPAPAEDLPTEPVAAPAEDVSSEPAPAEDVPQGPLPPAPVFPSCPKCEERAFVVTHHISEVKTYEWNADALKFAPVGESDISQRTTYRCHACGEEQLDALLADWIA